MAIDHAHESERVPAGETQVRKVDEVQVGEAQVGEAQLGGAHRVPGSPQKIESDIDVLPDEGEDDDRLKLIDEANFDDCCRPPFLVRGVIITVLLGVGFGIWAWRCASTTPHPYPGPGKEVFEVLAAALLTLAGVLPAVFSVVLVGKPSMRLLGGMNLISGWLRPVVAFYAAMWAIGLGWCLFGLIGVTSTSSFGVVFATSFIVTIGTPFILIVVSLRVQAEASTRLTLRRLSKLKKTPPKTRDAQPTSRIVSHVEQVKDSFKDFFKDLFKGFFKDRSKSLVKCLRDVGLSEHEAGDRNAVNWRMKGLASVGASELGQAEFALDELGFVVQSVIADRDQAKDGLSLLLEVGDKAKCRRTLVARKRRRALVARECISIWKAAEKEEHASPVLATQAAQGINKLLQDDHDLLCDAVHKMLQILKTDSYRAAHPDFADYGELTRGLEVREAKSDSFHQDWVKFLMSLKVKGYRQLWQSVMWGYHDGESSNKTVKKQRKRVFDAFAVLLLNGMQSDIPGFLERGLRDRFEFPISGGQAKTTGDVKLQAMLDLGAHCLEIPIEVDPQKRGEVIAALAMRVQFQPENQNKMLISTLCRLPKESFSLAVPKLIDSVASLADLVGQWHPHEKRNGELKSSSNSMAGAHQQECLVTLLLKLVAALTDSPDDLAKLDQVLGIVGKLQDDEGTPRLVAEQDLRLRRELAVFAQKLHDEDHPELAAHLAYRLLGFLLRGEDRFALAWLAWLAGLGDCGSVERVALPPMDLVTIVSRLLELSLTPLPPQDETFAGLAEERHLIRLPRKHPHAGRSYEEAFEEAEALLARSVSPECGKERSKALESLHVWARRANPDVAGCARDLLASLEPVRTDSSFESLLVKLDLTRYSLWEPNSVMTDDAWAFLQERVRTYAKRLNDDPASECPLRGRIAFAWLWGAAAGGHPRDSEDLKAAGAVLHHSPSVSHRLHNLRRAHKLPAHFIDRLGGVCATVGDSAALVTLMVEVPRSSATFEHLVQWIVKVVFNSPEEAVEVVPRLAGIVRSSARTKGGKSRLNRPVATCAGVVVVITEVEPGNPELELAAKTVRDVVGAVDDPVWCEDYEAERRKLAAMLQPA